MDAMNKHEPPLRKVQPATSETSSHELSGNASFQSLSNRIPVAPRPTFYQPDPIPDNIMDLLVERYTSFAQLVARGKLQPMDVATMRAICNQVAASAEDLQREALRRKHIVGHIQKCLDLLDSQPELEPRS
jgi:hypothetical protein